MRLRSAYGDCRVVDVSSAVGGEDALRRMPWCHRVLLENVLRHGDAAEGRAACRAFLDWQATGRSEVEVAFAPSRILMHDTTCGPALVDIAAMRDALAEAGGDPKKLNPTIPVASSVDHSVAVDVSAVPDALAQNMAREMARNAERYRFMKWAAAALDGFRVFPPGTGIMHTLNLERIATVVTTEERDGVRWAVPDTLVGTDSHTPMVNGLGVLGWGVGGIEAEGVMFGVPLSLRIPEVIGVRLTGALPQGVLATDLALVVTERLRKAKVSGEFVEYFGPGVSTLSAGERAVVANMAPEYGATTACFPIDGRTLDYLCLTGRSDVHVALVQDYAKANGLWHDDANAPVYTKVIEIDLASLAVSLAGPRRPQDRVAPAQVATVLGYSDCKAPSESEGIPVDALGLAAITSCTNTTDTGLLVIAGLLARNARRRGLKPPAWVKTSLTPGSPAAVDRLQRAGVLGDLEALGFHVAGYGCATCIGQSGPLLPLLEPAVVGGKVQAVAVLSGNRNFPGRVHSQIDDAFLASPAVVVAYALAGRAALDITRDALGRDGEGRAVTLADIWPARADIDAALAAAADTSDVARTAQQAESGGPWVQLDAPTSARFPWDANSSYLRRPPFVRFADARASDGKPLVAHPLLVVGDDVTTDHISPAGAIPANSDAGQWLVKNGENPKDLNVYASRRGNFEVMVRGLFTNRQLKNHLSPDGAPGETVFAPTGERMPVWRAAARYTESRLPVVVIAGERYGTGSSRDWAAKGVQLLGANVVLANSFERIHRANLICMGVLPLQLPEGWKPATLDVSPGDTVELHIDWNKLQPRCTIEVVLRWSAGKEPLRGKATGLLETEREVALVRAGGMIPEILRRAFKASR
jgi:aconitate hydratase